MVPVLPDAAPYVPPDAAIDAPIRVQRFDVPHEYDRWWCLDTPDDFGTCEETRDECMAFAGRLRQQLGPYTPISDCYYAARVACAKLHYVVADRDGLSCAPSIAQCKSYLVTAKKIRPEDVEVISPCEPTQ